MNATSQNIGTSDILYNLKSGSNDGLLIFDIIDKTSGNIILISDDTNYELHRDYTLVVEAQDRGTEPPRLVEEVKLFGHS